MRIFKLTAAQRFRLLEHGYAQKDIEAMVQADIPKAKTIKICFSETEILEWMRKKHQPELSIDELLDWWRFNAKTEFMNVSPTGLYVEYKKRRAKRKPLVMYKEMAVDNKPHKVY